MRSPSTRLRVFIALTLVGALLTVDAAASDFPSFLRGKYTNEWVEQAGTKREDIFKDVAPLRGGTVVSGYTFGEMGDDDPLPGQDLLSDQDGVLRRYDAKGRLLWSEQFGDELGSVGANEGRAVTTTPSGEIFVTGRGRTVIGGLGTLRRYGPDGTLRWSRNLGLSGLPALAPQGIDATTGHLYLGGSSIDLTILGDSFGPDAILARFDDQGDLEWRQTIPSPHLKSAIGVSSVATMSDGGVAVVGSIVELDRALPAIPDVDLPIDIEELIGHPRVLDWDAYARVYDAQGNLKWKRSFDTEYFEFLDDVEATDDAIYVGGGGESLGIPFWTGIGVVRRLSFSGKVDWIRRFDGSSSPHVHGLSSDSQGNLLVTGSDSHIFLKEIGPKGGFRWNTYLDRYLEGKSWLDGVGDIAAGKDGRVFVAGWTDWLFGDRYFGKHDGYLAGFVPLLQRRIKLRLMKHRRLVGTVVSKSGDPRCSGGKIRINRWLDDERRWIDRPREVAVRRSRDGSSRFSVTFPHRPRVTYRVSVTADRLPSGRVCAETSTDLVHDHR